MAKYLLFISALFCFSACKNVKGLSNTPDSIQEIIDEAIDTANLPAVKKTKVNGQNRYVLNFGASAGDGSDPIVYETCDTMHILCVRIVHDGCMSDYYNAVWETIWEK